MRAVESSDYADITWLLDTAFAPSRYESQLVCRLRARGKAIQEWVSTDSRGLSSYICYSKAFEGSEVIGFHLAPVAVRPDRQGDGVGSRLIVESLRTLQPQNAPVFVLGHPSYYSRFGFLHVTSPICPFDQRNEHFMALRWSEGSSFVIGYEEEFSEA